MLEPSRKIQREVRRVARERLDGAIDHLDAVLSGETDVDVETAVHEARKRCKASRGLARLVRPSLGDGFREFDRLVRDAADELSELRDAHAVLGTLDALIATAPGDGHLIAVRGRHEGLASAATNVAVSAGDPRIVDARARLVEARDTSQRWAIPRGFHAIEAGLVATYRRGRGDLRRAYAKPSDRRLHEWRKSVKYLWYQMQLLSDASPSVLGPLVDQLDVLGEALGDEHDLTVLVELLSARTDEYGTSSEVAHVTSIARLQQRELREIAFRAGATIYAEADHAFVDRIAKYWRTTVRRGPELSTGGLDLLAERFATTDNTANEPESPPTTIERERKFLVADVPSTLGAFDAVVFRQGYLVASDSMSVRVRDAGDEGCTLTIKAGQGAERTELEWPIDRGRFEAAWPHTAGRRIDKSRHRIPHRDGLTIELDVFTGELDGLVLAEVEFDSLEALHSFTPPDWFGPEVTDDGRFANASLALHGRPPPS